jgi:hypothetical protein
MGTEAIAASQERKPVVPLTTACWAVRQDVSFQGERPSIISLARHWPPRFKTVERSRITRRTAARASAVGACLIWLFIGAPEDGQCSEGNIRAQDVTVSTETGRKVPEPYPIRSGYSLVSQVAETMDVEHQISERGREKVDDLAGRLTLAQRTDAAPGTAAPAAEFAPTREQEQALERERERDRAEAVARTLTSTLRAQLNAVQSAAEAASIKQRQEQDRADRLAAELATLRAELNTARFVGKEAAQAMELGIRQTQALEQEREKANTLARELTFLRAELDVAQIAISKAVQPAEAEVKQEQALEQERGRAENLEREVAALRAELDRTRIEAPETAKATGAEIEQKQALEQELNQQRERAATLARELSLLRIKLNAARAAMPEAARIVEAAKSEQKQAVEKERGRTERLAGELASARKQADEHSRRLAAAHADVLQVTEKNKAIAAVQKLALASERRRADALAQELASVRSQVEAANRQLAGSIASRALTSRAPAVNSLVEHVAQFYLKATEGTSRSPEQTSVQTAASNSERSSASELPPEAQSTARQFAPELRPQLPIVSEESASASAAPHSPLDEQRLLARANVLLRQADISGARPLLEHAVDRGSARAAFMLAETYDTRVLRAWRARGIPGDVAKARELYERAQAGGIEDAKERIKALK